MKAAFVTGPTGIVGSAVVARLLDDPEMRVLALVRADSMRAAAERLDETLARLGVTETTVGDSGRLCTIAGDVEMPRFGLEKLEYEKLAASCTHLIHCAGAVRMTLPLEAARRSAVDSVGNVLQLAQTVADAGKLAKIDIVSTVGVAGRKHRLLREEWIGAEHRFHNTYEQAKAEAEQVVHDAVRRGMPVTVHRPSMVVGDSRTGRILRFQVFYHLVEFLSGRRTMGLLPDFGKASLDIVPVDFVAEAVVRSNATRATTGSVLHSCAGPDRALPLRHLQTIIHDHLAERGDAPPRPRYLSTGFFRAAVHGLQFIADARTRAALGTLPIFLDYLDANQAFDNTRTNEWLHQEGVTPPRVEDYLPRVLAFYFSARNGARSETRSGRSAHS